MQTRTLADFLKTAELAVSQPEPEPEKVAEEAPKAPATPEPKVAEAAPAAPAPEPEKEAEVPQEPQIPEGQVMFDPDLIKTSEQKWLLDNGYGVIPDATRAHFIYNKLADAAQSQKVAETQKVAAQLQSYGQEMYRGMQAEGLAGQLALGEMDMPGAMKVAAIHDLDLNAVIARAREMKAAATDVENAAGPSAFFGNTLATPAHSGASATTQAADRSAATVQMPAPALQGDTTPTSGHADPKLTRFTEAATLPGNPGLNHGQEVDQGKGAG